MDADLQVDVFEADIILDAPNAEALAVDVEDRDFVLDPGDGDILADFGAVGVPGPSNYSLWLRDGHTGTLEDFLQAVGAGGVTHEQLEAALAAKADKSNPQFTGTVQAQNLTVTGTTNATFDGGFF